MERHPLWSFCRPPTSISIHPSLTARTLLGFLLGIPLRGLAPWEMQLHQVPSSSGAALRWPGLSWG